MKVVVIPAEVSNHHDTIVANLSPAQLIMLTLPLFLGLVVLFVLPHPGKFAWYKLGIIAPLILLGTLASIRIGDQLLVERSLERLSFKRRVKVYLKQRGN